MKHRASFLGVLVCTLGLVLGLAGCSGEVEEYTPELGTATVSSPTIGEDGTLRVGIAGEESAPFTMTSNGEVTGLDVDIAAALADQMGLALELVNVESEGETALANGEVDILMSMVSDSTSSSVWVSDPYIETAIALFAHADVTEVPTRDSSPIIAAQGSSTSAWAVTTIFGDDSLLSASDLMSAFSSAETAEAVYVAADAVIGTYAALYQNVDMAPIALLEEVGGYCIGVTADNTDLQEAVTTALTTLVDGGITDIISTKWLGTALDLASLPQVDSSSSTTSEALESSDDTEDSEAGSNAVIPSS